MNKENQGLFGVIPIVEKWFNLFIDADYITSVYKRKIKNKARCLLLRKESDNHGEWKS